MKTFKYFILLNKYETYPYMFIINPYYTTNCFI